MTMQEITIQLSDTMKEFVDGRIASGDYRSPADFISHLLKEEQKRRALDYLKTKVREAEASGEPEDITAEFWDEIRTSLRQKRAQEQGAP
jgi:antitoxin ParD1/3/4